jgi:hypothetical protein
MKKQLEHSTELITAKAGLLICYTFEKYVGLPKLIDSTFPKPGSYRAFAHSKHVGTLVQMFHDGAGQLEDVRKLAEDKALQKIIDITSFPGSDALGNWLRRQGSSTCVDCLWKVMKQLFTNIPGEDFTLDIDTTIIEVNKGGEKRHIRKQIDFYLFYLTELFFKSNLRLQSCILLQYNILIILENYMNICAIYIYISNL